MPRPPINRFRKKYAYTALFPIRDAASAVALRLHLHGFDTNDHGSPFSTAAPIHLLRFIVIDRLPFEGHPAKQEALGTPYLVVMCDFDGAEVRDLADVLARRAPAAVCGVWNHCVAFPFVEPAELAQPGAADRLDGYLRRGQVDTLLYLADQPDATVKEILRAIRVQVVFAEFVARYQLADPRRLKAAFFELWDELAATPAPQPGSF
jgi:hypothetical protein